MKVNMLTVIIVFAITFAITAMLIETGEKPKENISAQNNLMQNRELDQTRNSISKKEYLSKNPQPEKEEKKYSSDLYVNNLNPIEPEEVENGEFEKTVEHYDTFSLTYTYPHNWKNRNLIVDMDTKAFIKVYKTDMFYIDCYTDDYDEFLQKFSEKLIEKTDNADSKEINIREIETNGSTFKIIEILDDNYVTNYMVFVKDETIIYILANVIRENYNEDTIRIFDKVFASAYLTDK